MGDDDGHDAMTSLEQAPVREPRRRGASPPATEEELWRRYWGSRDRALRNELLLRYRYLTAQTVGRLPSSIRVHWESDDLEGFATLGLVEAIERFESDSVVGRFPSYAKSRIRGAIFDELRRLDWLPRTVRRRVITYRSTAEVLSTELGRTPDSAEVLAQMGAGPASSNQILREVQSAQLAQLDAPSDASGEGRSLADELMAAGESPDTRLLADEMREELREALGRLPERQRTVVSLHILGGLTQEQIGAMLGVSNSRVCQIEATALQSLRQYLARRA
jgi:RNA polymerase sigma factor FliA